MERKWNDLHLAHFRMFFSYVFLKRVAHYYTEAIADGWDEHSYPGPGWLDASMY